MEIISSNVNKPTVIGDISVRHNKTAIQKLIDTVNSNNGVSKSYTLNEIDVSSYT